ncbi:cytochrome P450 2D6-like [Anneissia japonica]|uniref:cytochrome P450 2D6-like n=1 Tax=Anneissia japonica TaxID=1529436 RepID=UPI001425698C|nr:cytochrome P450 2D6-like [Anneissia japonica]
MLFFDAIPTTVDIQTIVLFFLVLLLSLRLLKSNKLPPGPRGWPIIGSIPHIDKESYLTFDKWAKEYGDIYTVKLGWSTAVMISSYDAIKSTLKDQGDKFADRPLLPIVELGITIPGSLVFDNGQAWNDRRRWTNGVLRNFGLGKKSLESRINIEADYLCQEIDKNSGSFNPLHCVNNAVSNIICSISFGDRFEYSDPEFKELLEGLGYLHTRTTFVAPVNAIPLLFYTPMYSRYRDVVTFMKAFIKDIIHQHHETFDSGDIRDVIDAYIAESEKEHFDPGLFSEGLLWRIVLDLFGAGTETTTTTILWMILYLVNYPDVQNKLQQEIDEILGQEKRPAWDDRHSMPYLEATIMEVQRLSNVIPITLRSTTEDIEINGYKIPSGFTIFVNLWSVHHDPDHWERPFNFEPERFLMDDLKTFRKKQAFIPFGTGRRGCIGELLARMELFLFTANLIQRFTFKVPDGKPTPSLNECVPGLTRSPKPYEIYVIKR